MADPRRAALYATLAETYAALARLEAEDAGGVVVANDAAPPPPLPAQPKPKAPRRRAVRPIPAPDPAVKVDEVTMARVKRRLRGMGVPT